MKRYACFSAALLIAASASAQVVGGGPVIGGGGSAATGVALLAGDTDGQTIQGITGEDKARVEIGDSAEPDGVRILSDNGAWVVDAHGSGLYLGDADEFNALNFSTTGVSIVANAGIELTSARVSIVSSQTPPTNANDACTAGDTIDTATFHYYCAATNTWVRVAMATWP